MIDDPEVGHLQLKDQNVLDDGKLRERLAEWEKIAEENQQYAQRISRIGYVCELALQQKGSSHLAIQERHARLKFSQVEDFTARLILADIAVGGYALKNKSIDFTSGELDPFLEQMKTAFHFQENFKGRHDETITTTSIINELLEGNSFFNPPQEPQQQTP